MKRREAVRLIAISGLASAGRAQQTHPHAKSTSEPATEAAKKAPPGAQPSAPFKPKHFSAHEFAVITRLADLIIPRDSTPGALDARVPEYVDLQVAEMPESQVRLSGGIQWLDRYCGEQFGKAFLDCTAEQQKSVLDRLAYRDKVPPALRAARTFFVELRRLVCDGFYSSKLGFAELGYKGNTFESKFAGCTHPEHA